MDDTRLREIETALARMEERSIEGERKIEQQLENMQKIQKDVEELKIGYAKVWALFAVGGWFVGAATSILAQTVGR